MTDTDDSGAAVLPTKEKEERPGFNPHLTFENVHQWQPDHSHLAHRRKSSRKSSAFERRPSLVLHRTNTTGKKFWKFTLRPWNDDEYQDWWFASTAIPLLAATMGPMANVLSIAALVTSWRMCLVRGVSKDDARICPYDGDPRSIGPDLNGQTYSDPKWCYTLNVVSLIVGFVGNFFLLCNFTNRIRYIIALPVTILMWYVATGLLLGIVASMRMYVPPTAPQQTYTQGYWYAVIAAAMYCLCSMMLMINMAGYFMGHYPQRFTLTESQRTLILQTMLFFIWLAGGAGLFSYVENKYGNGDFNWSYVNALYFCDVTILTVGFGDLYPTSDVSRGINFPYSVGGIIMLGLMVSSISKFAAELGSDKVVRKHVERSRARTIGRACTTSLELEHRETNTIEEGARPTISGPMNPVDRSKATAITDPADGNIKRTDTNTSHHEGGHLRPLKRVATLVTKPRQQRKPKLILLREEKDRFDAMRHIQYNTSRFKNWYALCLSVTAFGLLWACGAVVFWQCEKNSTTHMTYFKALYFCYVSLLTIGYGDLAPQSNAGRPFFVLWSLIAVPTMTILISHLGDTVISKFKNGTTKLADFTVLPKYGVWREFLERHPWILSWLQHRKEKKDLRRRLEEGLPTGPEPEPRPRARTIEELAKDEPTQQDLGRRLGKMIKQTANEVKSDSNKRYSYEEWVEITQLIRFTARRDDDGAVDENETGLIEWDWIGEDSPMMSRGSESDFIFDRLIESMNRFVRNLADGLPPKEVNAALEKETHGTGYGVDQGHGYGAGQPADDNAGDDDDDDDDDNSSLRSGVDPFSAAPDANGSPASSSTRRDEEDDR